MGIYQIKPLFQRTLQPLTTLFVKYKVSPDWMTYGAIFVAGLMAAGIYVGQTIPQIYILVALGVPVRLALNALDGQVARALDVADPMGEVKNEVGDRIADILIFSAFCFVSAIPLYISVFALCVTFLVPYVGILSKAVNGVREYSGLMGKPDRMVAVAIGLAVVGFTGWWLSLSIVLVIVSVLGIVSFIERLKNIHERS